MNRWIKKEILVAKGKGLAFTAYRPFKYQYERVGKFFCGTHSRTPSKYVSYSTAIAGCTVMCEKCFKKYGEMK